jgi:hypothetical protein
MPMPFFILLPEVTDSSEAQRLVYLASIARVTVVNRFLRLVGLCRKNGWSEEPGPPKSLISAAVGEGSLSRSDWDGEGLGFVPRVHSHSRLSSFSARPPP